MFRVPSLGLRCTRTKIQESQKRLGHDRSDPFAPACRARPDAAGAAVPADLPALSRRHRTGHAAAGRTPGLGAQPGRRTGRGARHGRARLRPAGRRGLSAGARAGRHRGLAAAGARTPQRAARAVPSARAARTAAGAVDGAAAFSAGHSLPSTPFRASCGRGWRRAGCARRSAADMDYGDPSAMRRCARPSRPTSWSRAASPAAPAQVFVTAGHRAAWRWSRTCCCAAASASGSKTRAFRRRAKCCAAPAMRMVAGAGGRGRHAVAQGVRRAAEARGWRSSRPRTRRRWAFR